MKKLIFVLSLFLCFHLHAQLFEVVDFYICKKESEAKKIVKRFDRAAIGKDYFESNGWYFIELEEDDSLEYYEWGKKKIYCIPIKDRSKIKMIALFNDDGNLDDDEEFPPNEGKKEEQ